MALSLAEEHATHYADSSLSAEREYYRIRALVELDRTGAAQRAATRFWARFPGNPYTTSIRRLVQLE